MGRLCTCGGSGSVFDAFDPRRCAGASFSGESVSGFDGGLPANFLLELYDAEKMELKSQVTNKVPIFEVSSNIICSKKI